MTKFSNLRSNAFAKYLKRAQSILENILPFFHEYRGIIDKKVGGNTFNDTLSLTISLLLFDIRFQIYFTSSIKNVKYMFLLLTM